jgi:four helix bundle protein
MAAEEIQVRSFHDLVVWQRSIQLCVAVYGFTKMFPGDELYGLRSQLRRASVSISSNIAEGCGRRTTGEFVQFLGIARGSTSEVQTQLVIARELGFGSLEDLLKCDHLSVEVTKMLTSMMRTLASKTNH